MHSKLLSILILALLGASQAAQAGQWTYRGSLNDGGKPANGNYDLRLTLTDAAGVRAIGQPLTLYGVAVKDGNFATEVDFGVDLSNAPALKLKTEVAQGGSGFVGLGEPTRFDPKAALAGICWDTTGNVVAAGEFLGSTNNVAVEIKANNLRAAQFKAAGSVSAWGDAPQVVLGSAANIASGIGATVGGGGATRDESGTPFSGFVQLASGLFSTVAGGVGNQATNDGSTVGGGFGNRTTGFRSTVSGGAENTAAGSASTVSGGGQNVAPSDFATVAGGEGNMASGQSSTVGGGHVNSATNDSAVVAGGSFNSATGIASSITGGSDNCAGGDYSWVGGRGGKTRPGNQAGDGTCAGNSADANGDEGTFVWADSQNPSFISTGPNQFLVRAQGGMAINTNTPAASTALTVAGNTSLQGNTVTSGNVSFGLVPKQMLNLYDNTFGIGIQTARMYFRVAPTGGYNWFIGGTHSTNTDDSGGGSTLMRLTSAGQLLTTTGTISSFSDARLKSDVSNYSGALDQIAALRPVHYRYTNAGKAPFQPEGTHLGFIAQEVQQVFPEWVSEDESGYLMLSMRGFEAVAVRGMQELQAENAALRASAAALSKEATDTREQMHALQSRLEAIEARLASQR